MTGFTEGHGTWRRLRRVSDANHRFAIAAVDHRDSLRVEFDAANPDAVPAHVLTQFKADIITGLGDRPSAFMLEPEYSVPQLTVDDTVHRCVGVICALEQQGYLANVGSPGNEMSNGLSNEWMPGWSPSELLRTGADAAKLLVLYRHDAGELTQRQERLVQHTVEACADAELPLFVEPVPSMVTSPDDRATVIIESARRLGAFGPMVLKLPHPGSGRCTELDDACGERPWALLSWGAGFDEFADQLAEACAAGCSGFMVGRALWRSALHPDTRSDAIRNEVVPRFDHLQQIAATGRPWSDRIATPDISAWPWSHQP